MRLAPVPLAFRSNFQLAIHNAGESSRTTHGAPQAVDACRYFAGLLLGALEGRSKEEIAPCSAPAQTEIIGSVTLYRRQSPRLRTVLCMGTIEG
jgi:ADP-ribosylglycohydrolase